MADDGPGDAVRNRFAERFDADGASEHERSDEKAKNEKKSSASENENRSGTSKNAGGARATNVKREWDNHSVYLPDGIATDLSRTYKRLDLDLDEAYGLSIKKTRHYYPLVVRLGLERLEELETEEVKERVERMEE